jgi:hypothetical protein
VLNVLEEGNCQQLIRHFLKRFPPRADRFEDIPIVPANNGSPILAESLAYIECEVSDRLECSDILEFIQDFIVISLCIGLFGFMTLQLRKMFVSLLLPLNFTEVTADILFLLILVELFRLLIIYLQERRVSIGVA